MMLMFEFRQSDETVEQHIHRRAATDAGVFCAAGSVPTSRKVMARAGTLRCDKKKLHLNQNTFWNGYRGGHAKDLFGSTPVNK
jgi:hypothetical protein